MLASGSMVPSRRFVGLTLAVLGCLLTPGSAAGLAPLDATATQRFCWTLDSAVSLADHATQLSQAAALTLAGGSSAGSLPGKVAARLRESSSSLAGLESWIQRAGTGLRLLFSDGDADFDKVHSLLSPPAALISDLREESRWQGLRSPDAWQERCSEDVLIEPFMLALESLRAELQGMTPELEQGASGLFAARSERAEAAGELAALETLLETNRSSRGETLAGVFNASRRAERELWQQEALRKQVTATLVHGMQEAQRKTKELWEGKAAADLWGQRGEAEGRLRRADKAVLEMARGLSDLVERRRDVSEKMRLHLKSTLAQCLPPAEDAPRSRYSRFATSSPAANAVQLSFEVADFLRHFAASAPALQLALEEALAEARAGADRHFRPAPELARWQEWAPGPGMPVLGPASFAERFEAAQAAHELQIVRGGRLAALHSAWLRWPEIDAKVQPAVGSTGPAPPPPEAPTGWWPSVGF